MTVAEFIQWLNTQDQGATVEVLRRISSDGYGGDCFKRVEFVPDQHAEYSDMRGNPFVPKGAQYENSRSLFLGDLD